MVSKINKARRAHGLPALKESRSLNRSSKRYSRHLMRTDRFRHVFPLWASRRRFRYVAEVLAKSGGWRPRPGASVRGWLRSPSHRAILLSRAYSHVGAGRARGRFWGRHATIWVAHFGLRR